MAIKIVEFESSAHKQPMLLIGNPLETQEELAQLVKCVEPQRLSAVLYIQGQKIDGFFSRLASLKKITEVVNRNLKPVDWLTMGTAYVEGMAGSLKISRMAIEPQKEPVSHELITQMIEGLCNKTNPDLLGRVVPVYWGSPYRRFVYEREKRQVMD